MENFASFILRLLSDNLFISACNSLTLKFKLNITFLLLISLKSNKDYSLRELKKIILCSEISIILLLTDSSNTTSNNNLSKFIEFRG